MKSTLKKGYILIKAISIVLFQLLKRAAIIFLFVIPLYVFIASRNYFVLEKGYVSVGWFDFLTVFALALFMTGAFVTLELKKRPIKENLLNALLIFSLLFVTAFIAIFGSRLMSLGWFAFVLFGWFVTALVLTFYVGTRLNGSKKDDVKFIGAVKVAFMVVLVYSLFGAFMGLLGRLRDML